ncbi:hypothetical protein ACET3Z_024346 [Daucus carota]
MNNSPPPPSIPDIDSISIQMFNDDDDQHFPAASSSLWDWTDFLDFDQFTSTAVPPSLPPPPPAIAPEPKSTDKVRKRDPRLVCSNYLAGRVPCACPEMDAKLAEMEEEEEIGPGKKKARTVRIGPGGFRCQVPGCGVDISELKGYHKRHKVCLGCANAISVFIDGENKRYCQQCGKFHILSDFDEGKRSCRRKLERHNNRRRRKSTDSKGLTERDTQQLSSAEDAGFDDVTAGVFLNNQEVEREPLVDVERPTSLLCSAPSSQNIQSDSGVSLAGSGETQGDEEKEKCNQSPSYYENKNVFSSVCPTGRISFKLYDWNPAEFPRRLRHQIFQWLANMPVELEGYVRPGCTILTVFVAMPNSMWVKVCGDPVASLQSLVAPGSMLFGKGSFYVYLNNVIFHVLKDGTSVVKVRVKKAAPKLHYVHPTCFEAGKPMELLVCGSNLLQAKFRFLVSFSGNYLSCDDVSFSTLNDVKDEDTSSSLDHQLLKICVPHTESNVFGPAFIEVENESGVSNFIPILIGDQQICSEMNTIQHKLVTSLQLNESQLLDASSSSPCDVSILRQKYFSQFILDVAWLLKGSALGNEQQFLSSSQIQRFNGLLEFLIDNQSVVILERVSYYVKIMVNNSLISGVNDADIKLCKKNICHANARLTWKFQGKVNYAVPVLNYVSQGDYLEASSKIDLFTYVPVTNQDIIMEENMFRSVMASTYPDRTETAPLLNTEVLMSVNNSKKQHGISSSLVITNTVLPPRPLIFLVSSVAVCFGICAIVFHPQKVSQIAVTIRRCLFDHS